MIFKLDWETADSYHEIPAQVIEEMVLITFPGEKLFSTQALSGGCVNYNVKIEVGEKGRFFILRVYLRDKDAAYREQRLLKILDGVVPVPKVQFVGNYQQYRFAIMNFLPGISLAQLLVSDKPFELNQIMVSIGDLLVKIASITFPKAGFFNGDLEVVETITQDGFVEHAKKCLKNEVVLNYLGLDIIDNIKKLIIENSSYLPKSNDKSLVHGDFDPANILVHQVNDNWEVSGILDWEFAFSGSVMTDVANMLRYAHLMPKSYLISFVQGLDNGGIKLSYDWQKTVYLLNLISLLDCLSRSKLLTQHDRCFDIKQLIEYIVIQLNY